ncbi:hypothetical protein ACQ4PT_064864 [Festuca glaucescens]
MDHRAKRVAIVGAGTSGLAACKHLLAPYARRFGVDECVRFRSKVVTAEYVGAEPEDAADGWERWAGNGEAFGDGTGVWRLTVRQHGVETQVHEFDFLILCIGRFGGVPNIPAFPANGGPEAFRGRVLHSMELSDMADADAAALVKGKRVAVVGASKTAFEIAAECAEANGAGRPCTMAGAGAASRLLAALLAPLAWAISAATGAYYRREIPMREHGMVPGHGFARSISSCLVSMLPDGFYDRVKEGSVVLARSRAFSFCADGLVLDGGGGERQRVVPADVVVLDTGFRGDQKLRDMFASPRVKDIIIAGATDTAVALYRECVHPRIAQMAVVGYAEGLNNMYSCEMASKWVARLLDGVFRLPGVRRMEESCAEWGRYYARRSGGGGVGQSSWRPCIGAVNLWYNDELCRDMGCDPRRKKKRQGLLAEWFQPYGAVDYADIL